MAKDNGRGPGKRVAAVAGLVAAAALAIAGAGAVAHAPSHDPLAAKACALATASTPTKPSITGLGGWGC